MLVAVVGLGYVGLVSAAGFAALGHEVRGTDADDDRIALLHSGRLPLFEPGLDEAVARGQKAGRLHFEGDPAACVPDADVVVLAVGTLDHDGGWQTRAIADCLETLAPELKAGAALVIRSTLPPDSLDRLANIVRSARADAGLPPTPLLLNPEFTREGTAVADFERPTRIVIGAIDDPTGHGAERVRALYEAVDAPVLLMTGRDACLAKLGSNLFLATKISFANELARLCDRFGAGVDDVVAAMGFDPRIGGAFLRPGVGFGGSCLPHQVAMTVRSFNDDGDHLPLLEAVDAVNRGQRDRFVNLLDQLAGGLAGSRIAMLGLTFKPGTDDIRDAPSLPIAQALLDRGAAVIAYDPMSTARQRAAALVPGLRVVESVRESLAGADAIGLVTEWPEFRDLDWREAAAIVRQRVLVDGRNALDPAQLLAAGFTYAGMGRGLHQPAGEAATQPGGRHRTTPRRRVGPARAPASASIEDLHGSPAANA